jgi:molybdate transport system substrate-binding protein
MKLCSIIAPVNRNLLALAVLLAVLFTACGSGTPPGGKPSETEEPPASATLYVFAAATLAESFGEIAQNFKAEHPGVDVVLNLAGSQQLAQQLTQGAPADVFASADRKQMEAIVADGRVDSNTPQPFAGNKLVVVLTKENPAQIGNLEDLARPGLRLVIADAAAPVGAYTMQFLDRAAQDASLGETFRSGFLENIVSLEENVRSVLGKVVLGEADAGIVYTTDYATVKDEGAHSLEIPESMNITASYVVAPINDGEQVELAKAFIEFILSPQGQAVLEKYGFIPVD